MTDAALAEVWERCYAWSRPTAKRLAMTAEQLGATAGEVEEALLAAGLMRRCVACGKSFPFNRRRRGGARCDRETCKLRTRREYAPRGKEALVLVDPATTEEAAAATTHAPGTPGKLGVLQMRASLGLPLFHADDNLRVSNKNGARPCLSDF